MNKYTAVKFVSTPEDWATANQMLIVRKDGVKFMVEVQKVFEDLRLVTDKDRKEMQEVRNFLRNKINFWPWNWWLNKRTVTGLKGSLVYYKD